MMKSLVSTIFILTSLFLLQSTVLIELTNLTLGSVFNSLAQISIHVSLIYFIYFVCTRDLLNGLFFCFVYMHFAKSFALVWGSAYEISIYMILFLNYFLKKQIFLSNTLQLVFLFFIMSILQMLIEFFVLSFVIRSKMAFENELLSICVQSIIVAVLAPLFIKLFLKIDKMSLNKIAFQNLYKFYPVQRRQS